MPEGYKKTIRVALAGNPNSGKTSVFNAITGMRQYVGNWPGVTVEKVIGTRDIPGGKIEAVDLPGTYSLSPYSPDERVARDYLLFERPEVVCVVVDGANLERNLYFVAQLVELDLPLVVALNMIDIARSRGIEIDIEKLSVLVGAPVIPTIGRTGKGIDKLVEAIIETAEKDYNPVMLKYGKDAETAILEVEEIISMAPPLAIKCHTSRFLSAMLLAGDPEITEMVLSAEPDREQVRREISSKRMRMESRLGFDGETALANARHGGASGIYHDVVEDPRHDEPTGTDRIDDVTLHKIFGLPIFIVTMFAIFWLTFTLGAFPMGWIESLFEWLGGIVSTGLSSINASATLISLIVDGVLGG
ncbi:ferrous iron transporter B, partial [bacterium]